MSLRPNAFSPWYIKDGAKVFYLDIFHFFELLYVAQNLIK